MGCHQLRIATKNERNELPIKRTIQRIEIEIGDGDECYGASFAAIRR